MKLSDFKKIPCIVWCLALNACAVLGWYLTSPSLFNSYNSPHYVYRLEIHNASPLQRLIHRDFKIPSVIRLYRVEPKTLLGESQVVDLWMDGEITWHLDMPVQANKVYVGRDVLFENIPSECTEASPIPGCPAAKP